MAASPWHRELDEAFQDLYVSVELDIYQARAIGLLQQLFRPQIAGNEDPDVLFAIRGLPKCGGFCQPVPPRLTQ